MQKFVLCRIMFNLFSLSQTRRKDEELKQAKLLCEHLVHIIYIPPGGGFSTLSYSSVTLCFFTNVHTFCYFLYILLMLRVPNYQSMTTHVIKSDFRSSKVEHQPLTADANQYGKIKKYASRAALRRNKMFPCSTSWTRVAVVCDPPDVFGKIKALGAYSSWRIF